MSKAIEPQNRLTKTLGGLPEFLFRYQWRSKRVVSLWLARKTPLYFDKKLLSPEEQHIVNFHGWHGTQAGRKEVRYWSENLRLRGCEVYRVFVNHKHLHVTVKIPSIPPESTHFHESKLISIKEIEDVKNPLIYPEEPLRLNSCISVRYD